MPGKLIFNPKYKEKVKPCIADWVTDSLKIHQPKITSWRSSKSLGHLGISKTEGILQHTLWQKLKTTIIQNTGYYIVLATNYDINRKFFIFWKVSYNSSNILL